MSVFCPDGYVPALEATLMAAGYWFPQQWAALQEAAAPQSATKPDNNSAAKPDDNIDAAVRAFSQWQVPAAWQDDAWRNEFVNIWSQTAHRLRNFLHQDGIKAYYFDNNGRQTVASNFWPTPAADGVLETGLYWPFGPPNSRYEQRPSYALFLEQSGWIHCLANSPPQNRDFLEGRYRTS